MMYPLKFKSIYKEKVWGGNGLKDVLNKDIIDDLPIGESWEVCAHPSGNSIVENGKFKDKTIKELLKEKKEEIFGKISSDWENTFPLLIKFIDAKDKLSVQVHPDDEYASKHENELGKTEMWYVVDADPGAYLIYGFKKEISKDQFVKSMEEKNLENILRKVPVKKGDVLFIPSGTIHAIGEGIILAEIQQNSVTTYRVYDWNRLGLDGKPRQLHVDSAIAVTDFENYSEEHVVRGLKIQGDGYIKTIYVCCEYFTTELLDIEKNYSDHLDGEEFEIYMCVDGEVEILYHQNKAEKLVKGETILMPANLGNFLMTGKGKIIRTYIKNPVDMMQGLKQKGYADKDLLSIAGLGKK